MNETRRSSKIRIRPTSPHGGIASVRTMRDRDYGKSAGVLVNVMVPAYDPVGLASSPAVSVSVVLRLAVLLPTGVPPTDAIRFWSVPERAAIVDTVTVPAFWVSEISPTGIEWTPKTRSAPCTLTEQSVGY